MEEYAEVCTCFQLLNAFGANYTTLETGKRRVLKRLVIPVAYTLPLYRNRLPPPPVSIKYIFNTALMLT